MSHQSLYNNDIGGVFHYSTRTSGGINNKAVMIGASSTYYLVLRPVLSWAGPSVRRNKENGFCVHMEEHVPEVF